MNQFEPRHAPGACSEFKTANGSEFYIVSEAPCGMNFKEAVQALINRQYEPILNEKGLDRSTEIYLRFYLSDIANQGAYLRLF